MTIRAEGVKTKLAASIDGSENQQIVFRPTPEFYSTVKIGRKRFGQLYRGERSPMVEELERIAKYFGKSIHDLIDSNN